MKRLSSFSLLLSAALLASCGAGGGGGSSTATPTPDPVAILPQPEVDPEPEPITSDPEPEVEPEPEPEPIETSEQDAQRLRLMAAVNNAKGAVAAVTDTSNKNDINYANAAISVLEAAIQNATDLSEDDTERAFALSELAALKSFLAIVTAEPEPVEEPEPFVVEEPIAEEPDPDPEPTATVPLTPPANEPELEECIQGLPSSGLFDRVSGCINETEPEPVMEESCFNTYRYNFDEEVYYFYDCLTAPLLSKEVGAELDNILENWRSIELEETGRYALHRNLINAYLAYAYLEVTGKDSVFAGDGVTIGFVDSGLDIYHPEFYGVGLDSEVYAHIDTNFDEPGDKSHGTAVAAAAAGWNVGIAPGATIIMNGIRNPDGIGIFQVAIEDEEFLESVLADPIDILNLSFGRPATPSYNLSTFSLDDYAASLSNAENLYNSSTSSKPIIVHSAGNQGYRHPSVSNYLGFSNDITFITVVATDIYMNISDFSNRCGVAKDFCIAAPGKDLYLPYRIPFFEDDYDFPSMTYDTISGTSFAAPIVSGGLAVMKYMFRDNLSNEELVERLFATAKKTGQHSNQSIYGQGFMDLGAAVNPWGIPSFMSTLSFTGNDVSDTVISLSTPLGDSLSQSLASEEVAAFDSLDAPFWFDANLFTVPSSGTSIASRLHHFNNINRFQSLPDEWKFSLKENASSGNIGHLSLTDGSSQFTIQSPYGVSTTVYSDPKDKEGVSVSWTPKNLDILTMEVGYLNEHQSLIGSQSDGAFGSLSSETFFIGSELTKTIGGWRLTAQGEIGQVNPSVGHSLFIDDISSLTTSTFNFEATRDFIGSSVLSFSIGQPLRVENGSIDLSLPVGRTHDGTVLDKSLSASLAPSGRQLDFTTKLEFPWLKGDVALGATFSNQPKHQLSIDGEWMVFAGYRAKW